VSDDFLAQLREEPRPELREGLRRRLRRLEEQAPEPPSAWARLRPLWTIAAGITLAIGLLSIPSVRAAARSFLDSFRVRSFAAIPVDPERFSRLEEHGLDLKTLFGENVEVLEEPGEPERVETLEAAADLAGIPVSVPRGLPGNATLEEIRVGGRGHAFATFNASQLEELLEVLEIDDIEVPYELDGLSVEIQTPRQVFVVYRRGDDTIRLVQSRAPEVELPEAVDLERLGEIGLRLAGMSAVEARLFAKKVDWGSTLLVPVPVNAATFREVDVNESKGLLVTFLRRDDGGARHGRWRSLVLWCGGDRVFALEGRGQGLEVLEMASSLG
jgi:hypothetical protein